MDVTNGDDASAAEFPVLSHKSNLQMVAHTGLNAQMLFTVPGLLNVEECQAVIDYAESLGITQQGSRGPAYGEAFRDNGRVAVQDESIAEALWHSTGLARLMRSLRVDGQSPVGCNPNIRIYRYVTGQRFGKHIDDSVEVEGMGSTAYTLLVYLSGSADGTSTASSTSTSEGICTSSTAQGDGGARGAKRKQGGQEQGSMRGVKGGAAAAGAGSDGGRGQREPEIVTSAVQGLQGGETVFYGARGKVLAQVRPQPGLALLHLHGEDRCLEHEALAVRAGSKYVLRSDVVFA